MWQRAGERLRLLHRRGPQLRRPAATLHRLQHYHADRDRHLRPRDLARQLRLHYHTTVDPYEFLPRTNLTVNVTNPDGSPADVEEIVATNDGFFSLSLPDGTSAYPYDFITRSYDSATATLATWPSQARVVVTLANGDTITRTVDTTTDATLDIALPPPPITVTGLVRDLDGNPTHGNVTIECGGGQVAFDLFAPADDPSFAVPVQPSTGCSITTQIETGTATVRTTRGDYDLTTDTTVEPYDLVPHTSVTVNVTNPDGSPAAVSSILAINDLPTGIALADGTTAYPDTFYTTAYDSAAATLATWPSRARVVVTLTNGVTITRFVDTTNDATLDIALPPPANVVVDFVTLLGDEPTGGSFSLTCPEFDQPFQTLIDPLSVTVPADVDCTLHTYLGRVFGDPSPSGGYSYDQVEWDISSLVFSGNTTYTTPTPTTVPLTIHVLDATGQPAEADTIRASQFGDDIGNGGTPVIDLWSWTQQRVTTSSTTVQLLPDRRASIEVIMADGTFVPSLVDVTAQLTDYTVVMTNPPQLIAGSPTSSNDDDGVSDVTEALGPNGGDGNSDGIPDNQQANVTSLPSSSGNYVTLSAPTGLEVADVAVVDPTAYTPPAQLTLPEGLTSFTLVGVPVGEDITLSIYTASTADVTGYAKYQDGVWSVLPSDRVSIVPGRVDITLTDGGIGDDDGVANGTIVDPGGIVIQSAPLDVDPPTVTTDVSPAPNAAGWHNTAVTITATCDDPSGVATCPPAQTLTADGADQTASFTATDIPGNSTTVTVGNIDIDRTTPVVTATVPSTVASTGTVAITCSASDALSGIATQDCADRSFPASQLSLGTNTLTFTATDVAGNTTTITRTISVTAPPNTAPTVLADMGVAGLQQIGFQTGIVAITGSFTDAQNNGPFTATVRWQAGGSFTPLIIANNGRFTAAWIYLGTSTRTATVKICDAAGACGTDDITIRPSVTTKITPIAQCVTDRGKNTSPRYTATFAYNNPASFPIAVPVLANIENTFTSTPTYRGQPQIFMPGRTNNAVTTNFQNGNITWKLNGTTATAKTNTTRC